MPVLNVPYLSQTNNALNPGGSCNVTSVAMSMAWYGIKGTGNGQLEDQLYSLCLNYNLDRHIPEDLVKLFSLKGLKAKATLSATANDIKKSIDNGNPVVINGYFTASGHYILIIGYDDTGFIVHDPWGEWDKDGYYKNTWDEPERGKNLHYSYGLIERTCRDNVGYSVIFPSK